MALERVVTGKQLKEHLHKQAFDDIDSFLRSKESVDSDELSLRDLLYEQSDEFSVLYKEDFFAKIDEQERYRVNGHKVSKTNLEACIRVSEYEDLSSGEVLAVIEFGRLDEYVLCVGYWFSSTDDLFQWLNHHREAFHVTFKSKDERYTLSIDSYLNSKKVEMMLLYSGNQIAYRKSESNFEEKGDWESSARDWLGDLGIIPESFQMVNK